MTYQDRLQEIRDVVFQLGVAAGWPRAIDMAIGKLDEIIGELALSSAQRFNLIGLSHMTPSMAARALKVSPQTVHHKIVTKRFPIEIHFGTKMIPADVIARAIDRKMRHK